MHAELPSSIPRATRVGLENRNGYDEPVQLKWLTSPPKSALPRSPLRSQELWVVTPGGFGPWQEGPSCMTWTGDSIPFADASAIVSAQHESYDGTGFPRGLKGEVPLGSRVLRIAAAFDALVTGRPASGTISIPAAKEEILRASGTRFDPKILLGVGTLDLFDDCMVRCC